jgi:hypothetical protein
LYFGYRVIGSSQSSQPTATFKFLGLNATAKGAGAVIMMTAGLWAYCGVRIAPNLTTDASGSKVYSFQTTYGKVTAPEFAIAAPHAFDPLNGSIEVGSIKLPDGAKLGTLFKDSVLASQAITGKGSKVTIHGKPAVIDPESTEVIKMADGSVSLSMSASTRFSTSVEMAKLTYIPEARGTVLVFVPHAVKPIADSSSYAVTR